MLAGAVLKVEMSWAHTLALVSAQGFVIQLNIVQGWVSPAPVLLHDLLAQLPPGFGLIVPH